MFLGHYAIAFGAKKAAPKVSLGTLVLSAQFIDLLWPLLLLFGVEHVRIDPGNTAVTPLDFYDYPITHSLAGSLFWALAFSGIYYALRRSTRGALVVGLTSFSHWLLDLLTHRPDLALAPGTSIRVGLGLWSSVAGTLAIELGITAAGVFFYSRATKPSDRIGRFGLWGLVSVLVLIYFANIFGPPPPNVQAVAITTNALWLFVAWAYWVDRHRTQRN
jgi:hypothetical protein